MYRKNSSGWMKHWDFELMDIILLEFTFFLSYILRHSDSWYEKPGMYVRLGVLMLVVDIVVIFFSESYKHILERRKGKEFFAVIQHVTTVYLVLLLYEFIIKETYLFSRMVFLLSWGLGVVGCYCGRIALKYVVRRRISSEKNQSNMMIISSEEHITSCVQQLRGKRWREYRVCCISMLEVTNKERIDADIPIIYGEEETLEYVRQNVVDEVLIDTFESKEKLNKLVNLFLSMGITVHIGLGFLPDSLPNRFMEKIGNAQVLTTSIKTATGWEIAIKRLMDMAGGCVGLLLTGIAYLFVAPAIKKASPGPVFFKQERVGTNGRTFYMYKFRSMYMDAEERKKELMEQNEMKGLMFKMENDPRIIGSEKGPGKGIGNFIRKTSIDELPQFWNILKGDMSLVGTRPPTVNEYEQYDLHHKIRLSMKPGLTGMWQVSGRSDITDFDEVVRLDTEYIENWSLGLDIQILFKTVGAVLNKEGSK